MKALLVVQDDDVRRLWEASLVKAVPGEIAVTHSTPDDFTTERQILDLLDAAYDIVVIPLTLPNYNSLRIAEYAHRLASPTRVILCSGTNANPEHILQLFDAFILSDSVSVGTFRDALTTKLDRETEVGVYPEDLTKDGRTSERDVDPLELAIGQILKGASCFQEGPFGFHSATAGAHHYRQRLRPSDDLRRRIDRMAGGSTAPAKPRKHTILLLHGIRDFGGPWMGPAKRVLEGIAVDC